MPQYRALHDDFFVDVGTEEKDGGIIESFVKRSPARVTGEAIKRALFDVDFLPTWDRCGAASAAFGYFSMEDVGDQVKVVPIMELTCSYVGFKEQADFAPGIDAGLAKRFNELVPGGRPRPNSRRRRGSWSSIRRTSASSVSGPERCRLSSIASVNGLTSGSGLCSPSPQRIPPKARSRWRRQSSGGCAGNRPEAS